MELDDFESLVFVSGDDSLEVFETLIKKVTPPTSTEEK